MTPERTRSLLILAAAVTVCVGLAVLTFQKGELAQPVMMMTSPAQLFTIG